MQFGVQLRTKNTYTLLTCAPSRNLCQRLRFDDLSFFAKHFESVYANHDSSGNISFKSELSADVGSCYVEIMDVFNAITDLNNNLSSGPDGIPVEFLKSTK